MVQLQAYQNHLHDNYNNKVWARHFYISDLVLKENLKNQMDRENPRKFEPNWLGPYIITIAYGFNAYQLATPEGESLLEPINNMHLCKYCA